LQEAKTGKASNTQSSATYKSEWHDQNWWRGHYGNNTFVFGALITGMRATGSAWGYNACCYGNDRATSSDRATLICSCGRLCIAGLAVLASCMRLPCWNVTRGAFAVFGCFARLKCCGLSGLFFANFPFAAFWFETVAVFAWFRLPAP